MIARANAMQLLFSAVLAAAMAATPSGVKAQPAERTITIVVPTTPATGQDIVARVLSEEFQRRLGQTVVVENKPGASGNIGTYFVARAAPDGLTLLLTSTPFTNNVGLFKNLPYDPIKSFEPIVQCTRAVIALAVHPSLPVTNTKEFIDYVKARPGAVDYASPGYGTIHHLTMELFKLATHIQLTHIPYKGTAPAVQDLLGAHVGAMFLPVHVGLPLYRANQIRFLAVAAPARAPELPDVPTLAEQGFAGVEVDFWNGLLAPAGTPREIIEHYNKLANDVLHTPEITEKLARQGLTVIGGPPERFAELIARDLAKWPAVVKQAGIASE